MKDPGEIAEKTNEVGEANQRGTVPALWGSSRLALAIVGFLGFVNLYALRVNMSVAMVCMVNHTAVLGLSAGHTNNTYTRDDTAEDDSAECGQEPNGTSSFMGGEFVWPKSAQGLILGSFFWGYILTQIPGGWLAARFGGRRVFGYFMLVNAVCTLLTPLAARTSVVFLIVLRFVGGLAQGQAFPAMQDMWAHWAPPLERSFLCGFSVAGSQIGNVLTFPLAGVMCEYGFDGGWPTIFYVLGTTGLIWFCLWMYFSNDNPNTHPRISEEERQYITHSLRHVMADNKKIARPWCTILRSRPVIAIVLAHVCANWGTYTFLTNIPSYMKEVLRFDIKSNGLLSAIPYIGFWAMIILSGCLADFFRSRHYLSTTAARKIFNSMGMFLPAAFVIGTGFMDCSQPVIAVALLATGVSFSGCQYGSGFLNNPVDIAPMYAGIILGISNTVATIPGFLAPFAIGYITEDQTREQWQKVFYITAAIYCVGAVAYILLGSGEVQEWAYSFTTTTALVEPGVAGHDIEQKSDKGKDNMTMESTKL